MTVTSISILILQRYNNKAVCFLQRTKEFLLLPILERPPRDQRENVAQHQFRETFQQYGRHWSPLHNLSYRLQRLLSRALQLLRLHSSSKEESLDSIEHSSCLGHNCPRQRPGEICLENVKSLTKSLFFGSVASL